MICVACGADSQKPTPAGTSCRVCQVHHHVATNPLGVTSRQIILDLGISVRDFCNATWPLARQGVIYMEPRPMGWVWVKRWQHQQAA